ncbi:MAG: guanylate kinase [Desulfobacteraceae bacterium]|nr:guanylate kinase [Desulfobacteraceae bacterium]
MNNPGHLFIISAPSGAGKSTLCNILLERFESMRFSVSYTTRKPRGTETHGTEYFFISKEEFAKGIKNGKWAEWAEVHNNYYGTSSEFLNKTLASGCDVLLDIDIQGAMQMTARYPDSITVFVMPPSPDALRTRLESRGVDSKEVIDRRIANAEKEIAEKDRYRHVVVNDKLSEAGAELVSIIEKYHSS